VSVLTVGLTERGQRRLRLVLPDGWHKPTLYRWPWLRNDLPLEVWTHTDRTTSPHDSSSRTSSADEALLQSEPEPVNWLNTSDRCLALAQRHLHE
jgi:hypothetical protein